MLKSGNYEMPQKQISKYLQITILKFSNRDYQVITPTRITMPAFKKIEIIKSDVCRHFFCRKARFSETDKYQNYCTGNTEFIVLII